MKYKEGLCKCNCETGVQTSYLKAPVEHFSPNNIKTSLLIMRITATAWRNLLHKTIYLRYQISLEDYKVNISLHLHSHRFISRHDILIIGSLELYITIQWYSKRMTNCCILTFDPAKNAIPRWCTGRRWHILMAVMRGNRVGGNWLMKWDEVKKFPWYIHRLMHRKRVNCELHDSYFRWMMIQHAIPKIK